MNSNAVLCLDCNVEYVPWRNGVKVLETCLNDQPYKLWNADLLQCPGCGHQVVARFGGSGTDNHDPTFDTRLQMAQREANLYTCNEKPLNIWKDKDSSSIWDNKEPPF